MMLLLQGGSWILELEGVPGYPQVPLRGYPGSEKFDSFQLYWFPCSETLAVEQKMQTDTDSMKYITPLSYSQ